MKEMSPASLRERFGDVLGGTPAIAPAVVERAGPPPTSGWRAMATGLALGILGTFSVAHAADTDAGWVTTQLTEAQGAVIEKVIGREQARHGIKVGHADLNAASMATDEGIDGFIDELKNINISNERIAEYVQDAGKLSPVALSFAKTKESSCVVLLPELPTSMASYLFGNMAYAIAEEYGVSSSDVLSTIAQASGGVYSEIEGQPLLSQQVATFVATYIAGHEGAHCVHAPVLMDATKEVELRQQESIADLVGVTEAINAAEKIGLSRTTAIKWADGLVPGRLQGIGELVGASTLSKKLTAPQYAAVTDMFDSQIQYFYAGYALEGMLAEMKAGARFDDVEDWKVESERLIEKGHALLAQESPKTVEFAEKMMTSYEGFKKTQSLAQTREIADDARARNDMRMLMQPGAGASPLGSPALGSLFGGGAGFKLAADKPRGPSPT